MMTLRNMRENGVRSLAVTCGALACHHCAIMDVSEAAGAGRCAGGVRESVTYL
jgi:hypothetical protein